MPQFILDLGPQASTYNALDAFTQGYLEAMFFTECEHGTDRNTWDPETQSSLPGDVGFSDLAPDTLEAIKRDCEAFQTAHREDLDEALDNGRINGYDEQAAGRDFWYSRAGHGVGFWDRDLGDIGDTLDRHAKAFGETWVYLGDDGRVYA